MSRNVYSDAMGVEAMDTSGSMKLQSEIQEGVTGQNKATAYAENRPHQQQPISQPTRTQAPRQQTRHITNQFNISGGTIGQAAIGNHGPVHFDMKRKLFRPGASNVNYKITGGNFAQANIGGTSTFNNKDTTVGAGGDAGNGDGGCGNELETELTLCILEKGVTVEEFMQLLEKNLSLTKIALSIPNNPDLRKRMVKALLMD